ncbi:MAG: AI-2E family transporter [Nevskiaceae bacterium]|jgi:predicted PurR-regulated permease PerM|nr:AI-2E family transporter [Nevskiaceae bacterium]
MIHHDDVRALRRLSIIAILLVVVVVVVLILLPMAMPIAWAIMLGFLLQPVHERLTRKLGNHPNASAAVLTALTPIALVVPAVILGSAFAGQVGQMARAMQQNPALMNPESWLDVQQHPHTAWIFQWFTEHTDLQLADLRRYLRQSLQSWAGTIAGISGKVALNIASTTLKFFLMLFVLFFAVRDGGSWFARLSSLLPLEAPHGQELFARLGKVTRAVVYGCGLTATVQGSLVGIGFAITGLSGPVVFGVIATVSALLPFGGAALVWVPGVLYLIASGHFGMGIFLLAWGGVISLSDNFIRPLIISRYTPVPTLLVFLGVIGGVATFGLLGFIAGPVILVLATELLRFAESYLKRPA